MSDTEETMRWPEGQVLAYYDRVNAGEQTVEKHIRWIAELFVKDLDGGFGKPSQHGEREVSRLRRVAFRAPGKDVEVELWAPEGCYGFSLQMCLEEQLRVAVSERMGGQGSPSRTVRVRAGGSHLR